MVVEMVQNSTFQKFYSYSTFQKFYSYSTFIHLYSTFIHLYSTFVSIQHYYLFKIQHLYLYSTVLFVHKIIIHSETIYPFNNFLFIQDLLSISLTHGSDVFLQWMDRGQREAQAIIGTLKRYRPLLH